jgi:hypothetical protein
MGNYLVEVQKIIELARGLLLIQGRKILLILLFGS